VKFLPHRRITDGRGWSFVRGEPPPARSPVAAALLQLDGVAVVYLGEDFVTVTRAPDGEAWATLRIRVIAALAEALASDLPAVVAPDAAADVGSALEDEIRQVLGTYVRPGVARDGGDIVFQAFEPASGVLFVRLDGACGGCPSARRTLKDGVERIVRRFVPEVLRVEETAAEPAPASRPGWLSRLAGRDGAGRSPGTPGRALFTHNGRRVRD
jgi:Fe-S cluster biogenesis protein NfuA